VNSPCREVKSGVCQKTTGEGHAGKSPLERAVCASHSRKLASRKIRENRTCFTPLVRESAWFGTLEQRNVHRSQLTVLDSLPVVACLHVAFTGFFLRSAAFFFFFLSTQSATLTRRHLSLVRPSSSSPAAAGSLSLCVCPRPPFTCRRVGAQATRTHLLTHQR
jgi:hypothetical protein